MKSIEMTSGSLWKNILLFSLPLMLTQVLEVLFNLSDVAIAGKYAYNTYVALGAVGSTTTLVSLFTGLSVTALAGDSDFEIIDGTELYQYTGTDTDVVIPDGITRIDEGAFAYNEFLNP